MDYTARFKEIIEFMGEDFNWTLNIDKTLIETLIRSEIKEKHPLFGKKIIPIAMCKNKYDVLAYFEEDSNNRIVAIHFRSYPSNNENEPSFEKYENFEQACVEIMSVYFNLYKNSRYNLMIQSEEYKKQNGYETFSGFYAILPKIYDTLFKMNEFRGQLAQECEKDLLDIQDLFQFFCLEFPYKIRDILLMVEIGSYTDACVLLRSLLETFVYFKYYIQKNDGKKLRHYVMHDKKNIATIKDIFEKIVPGFYDYEYAQLCSFAHGNPLMMGVFRGNVDKKEPLKFNMFNINIDWFSYVLNLTIPLILGFYDMFEKVYPKNTITTYKPLEKDIDIVKKWINDDLENRYEIYPKQRKMIDSYRRLISFSQQD